ncbi:MAG: hypothetical protein AAFZ18_23980 [Myxococcota bacterium]
MSTARTGLLIGLILLGVASVGCLPNVQSVRERREAFDRGALRGSLILDAPPANMKPIGAVFGDRAKLLGYMLEPERPTTGSRPKVTFFWSALRPMAEEYQIFIHGDAVGEEQSRIHGDHFPARGRYPTDVWQEGEVIQDPFTISIPPGYGGKHLGLFTGMYKGDHRVPLTDGGTRPRTGDNRSRAVDIFF